MALLLVTYHWLVRATLLGVLLNGRRHPRVWPTTFTTSTTSPTTGTIIMKSLALLLLLPTTLAAQAPTAPAPMALPALLARYAEAIGPIASVQTRRITMRVSGILPDEIPVVAEAMRPNLLRKSVTLMGAVQLTGMDGTRPWRVDPFASARGTATDVPAAELEDFLEETDFDGPLLNAAAKGIVLSYAGPKVVRVAGVQTPVHAVGVRWPNGRTATVHLDARSYLEVLRTQRRPVMGSEIAMTVTPSDYRLVQGVRVPFLMEIAPEGAPQPIRLRLDKVEFNLPMERRLFRRP